MAQQLIELLKVAAPSAAVASALQKTVDSGIPTSSSASVLPNAETLCAVCVNVCDGAHYCINCFKAVHAICGETPGACSTNEDNREIKN